MEKIKILIIEDSTLFRALYDEILYDDVFEKKFAENGEDGLILYQEWKPDIILLDMVLPIMSGYSVLKEIRTKLKDISTTIIVQTTVP
ncbi:MAG: response regulator [Desulfobacterales bacterium]|nr:response regulator [Desulfobacterales bacterium]